MIEGVSGLLAVHGAARAPALRGLEAQLVWPNGAIAQMFAADDPDSLRGPQFDAAWCDELAKWRRPRTPGTCCSSRCASATHPQVVVTTTPRPIPLLKKLMADAGDRHDARATADNADNLAPAFLAEMTRRYGGTALGRQELDGEIVEDTSGALWRRDWIDAHRVERARRSWRASSSPSIRPSRRRRLRRLRHRRRRPRRRRPRLRDRRPHHAGPRAARVGARRDRRLSRLRWPTASSPRPTRAATSSSPSCARSTPPCRSARCTPRAASGCAPSRSPRSTPKAASRTSATFAELEDQMCAFGADGLAQGKSPDRLDALVWALTDLMLDAAAAPQSAGFDARGRSASAK